MKYNDNGIIKDIIIKSGDTLPVGTIVDYDGEVIPDGYIQVEEDIVNTLDGNETNKAPSVNAVKTTLTPINEHIDKTKYLSIQKSNIGGSGSTKEIDVSKLEGNRTFLILIYATHSEGTSDYCFSSYLLREYSNNNTLVRIDKKQLGNIDLSLTYNPTNNILTINSVGTYGCQYSLVIM